MQSLTSEYGVTVPKTAIILLSYNLADDTRQCIESIRRTILGDSRQIIVVDNASTDDSVLWLRRQQDIILKENHENAGFPAGCNQGIELAEKDADIFLLNNDTILPPNSLFWLKMGLYENDSIGTAGSVSNHVANNQQISKDWQSEEEILSFGEKNNVPMKYPYEEKLFLIGFALLIKRTALNKVGMLDEIFTPGNSEDVDYGLRMLNTGYRNILCKNSFILHFGSRSFQKLKGGFSEILNRNHKLLNSKWGMDLTFFMFPKLDLVNLIQENQEASLRILDVGCGCGATMAKLKSNYPYADVYGIESIPKAAALAANIGNVVCGDIEQLAFPYEENYFDYCIISDVLECLKDPKSVLQRLRRHIKKGGQIIVCMPNVKHWSVLLPLLKYDLFPYSDSGILNTANVKLYTRQEIQNLIRAAGYEINHIFYKTVGTPNPEEEAFINLLTTNIENLDKTTLLAYQYIVQAVVNK